MSFKGPVEGAKNRPHRQQARHGQRANLHQVTRVTAMEGVWPEGNFEAVNWLCLVTAAKIAHRTARYSRTTAGPANDTGQKANLWPQRVFGAKEAFPSWATAAPKLGSRFAALRIRVC